MPGSLEQLQQRAKLCGIQHHVPLEISVVGNTRSDWSIFAKIELVRCDMKTGHLAALISMYEYGSPTRYNFYSPGVSQLCFFRTPNTLNDTLVDQDWMTRDLCLLAVAHVDLTHKYYNNIFSLFVFILK